MGSKKGHPGNAESNSPENSNLLELGEISSPSSAFPGTPHFMPNAEIGICGTRLQ
jgi:hypothetical protein